MKRPTPNNLISTRAVILVALSDRDMEATELTRAISDLSLGMVVSSYNNTSQLLLNMVAEGSLARYPVKRPPGRPVWLYSLTEMGRREASAAREAMVRVASLGAADLSDEAGDDEALWSG